MNYLEARDAFVATVEDIISLAKNAGMTASSNCYLADRDLTYIEDNASAEAAVIASEITIGIPDADETIVFECAVSISDGEVHEDELTDEMRKLRENVKGITDKVSATSDKKECFVSICHECDEEIPEPEVRSNKSFYIGACVAAVAIILLFLIIGR